MTLEETLRQTEAILRFNEEVDRRLAEHGIAGAAGAIRCFSDLCSALSRVSLTELEHAGQEASDLCERLQGVARELDRLSDLKDSLEDSS